MPNNFLTPKIIANEALMVLQANLVMANLVHKDYSKEFVKVGDTITVRKPAKFIAKNFTGETSNQDATEGSVLVKMDRFRDITVPVTSKELTLDIKDFSTQIVTPAMQAIAQAIDEDLIAVGLENAKHIVKGNAKATKPEDIGNMAKLFDVAKVPLANRRVIMHPTHKYRYVMSDNMSKVSESGSEKALRDAEIGKVYSFDTYMDQNCPDAPVETGTATAYKVTAKKGEETVKLTDVDAATGTVKKGDSFIVEGYKYTIVEDATAVDGTIETVKIDQPLHADFTAVNALLIKEPNSLAFHRNGIALVTRNLSLPMGASKAYIASANGLGVRVVIDYDTKHKQDTISFDIIYGIKELDEEMIGKIKG